MSVLDHVKSTPRIPCSQNLRLTTKLTPESPPVPLRHLRGAASDTHIMVTSVDAHSAVSKVDTDTTFPKTDANTMSSKAHADTALPELDTNPIFPKTPTMASDIRRGELQDGSLLHDPRPSLSSKVVPSAFASPETAPWKALLALDPTSRDFTRLAIQLLNDQRKRKPEAPQFTEEEALEVIELIEPTILQHPDIAADLKSTAFTVLRRLCGVFGRLPISCLINEDFKMQEEMPVATRGYTDLWKRDWNGRKVAVKALRFGPDDDRSKTTKRFCKEALLWKRSNHPNVLPFYGGSMIQNQFCMVSPWMENGNVLSYTRKNPEGNRLQLLIDVASGLEFLHQIGLVHGDVRGSNILISDGQTPRALLGDYGLNTIIFDPFSLTRASINWTAPELLTPDNFPCQSSIPSDIYAFAMVIYEVLTGTSPFADRGKTELACKIVIENERPLRPRDSEKLGFTDKIWEILQTCWEKDPSARPSIDAISADLKRAAGAWVVDVPAFILSSKAGAEQAMDIKDDQAKDLQNQLSETLDRIGIDSRSGKTCLKYLQRLCGASGVLPASLILTDGFDDLESRPFTSGGFTYAYKATYKGQRVVAKAVKTTSVDDLENIHKRFVKEVVGRRWLQHENVLPFIGITPKPPPFSIVSAWIENGNITSFIETNPDQNPFFLLADVTNGLRYLHQHDFVHGDLKGANILINSGFRACLADFGLAAIVGDTNSSEEPSDYKPGGSTRWMAPEILNPERYEYTKRSRKKLPSKSTDIYALGMTILEVITGREPFEHTNADASVVSKVLDGFRPDRPIVGFSNKLWALLDQMWLEEFESTNSSSVRPNTTSILERLQDEAENWSPMGGKLVPSEQIKRRVSVANTSDSSGFVGVGVDDLLAQLDQLIGPESTDDHLGVRDASAWDEQTSPIASQTGGFAAQEEVQSQSRSSAHPPAPSSPPVAPRPRKQGVVNKVWNKRKKLFAKKFERGGRAPPNLSDNLAPERDDEPKWDDVLFFQSQESTVTKN